MLKVYLFTITSSICFFAICQEKYNVNVKINNLQSISLYSISLTDTLIFEVKSDTVLYLDPLNHNYFSHKQQM